MLSLLESILDISSWVLAGTFLGLIALGGVYTYNASRRPPVPNLTIEPVQNQRDSDGQTEKTFRPLNEFHLVQRYSESASEPETPESTDTDTGNGSGTPQEPPAPSGEINETQLPFKLLGTITGTPQFQRARVQNLEERKSKTLQEGDAWGALTVEEIHDNKIIIRNDNTNQVERLSLRPERPAGRSRP